MVKSANETETTINLEARRECEDIMKKIYDENPSYWPYGLDIASHDGGVYMIREASTKKPIGFTGWQERMEGSTKVGFYSIGILQEYRNNGFAKQALSKLISIKAANVDCVKALVMKHNEPSLALADSLNVPVVKAGSVKQAKGIKDVKELLRMIGLGGIPAVAGMDMYTYGDEGFKEYLNKPVTPMRAAQAVFNTIFGAAAAKPKMSVPMRLGAIAGIPMKEFALQGVKGIPQLVESQKRLADAAERQSVTPAVVPQIEASKGLLESLTPAQKALGLAGLAGLGYGGYKGLQAIKEIAQAQSQAAKGKIRVTLPTKSPTDEETFIELPFENIDVSKTQFEKLQRDLRKKLRKETKERTEKRGPRALMEPKEAAIKQANVDKIVTLLNYLNV